MVDLSLFYHHFNHNCSFKSQAIIIIVHFLYLNYDTDISFFFKHLILLTLMNGE